MAINWDDTRHEIEDMKNSLKNDMAKLEDDLRTQIRITILKSYKNKFSMSLQMM